MSKGEKDFGTTAVVTAQETSSVNDLIARLEKATGPDRELNKAIPAALGYVWNGAAPGWRWEHANGTLLQDADFTGSIDAALTLVPEGWWATIECKGKYFHAGLEYVGPGEIDGPEDVWARNRPSPAIALCIAVLKARTA